MKVFVYEYLCGAAVGDVPGLDALRPEGAAMLRAVLEDFNQVQGVSAQALVADDCDLGLAGSWFRRREGKVEEDAVRELAAEADVALVIAPECDDLLRTRCRWVEETGTPLLVPSPEALRLAGDKLALSRHLAGLGVPTPESRPYPADNPLPARFFPAVWKPRHGAGSLATFKVSHPGELPACREQARAEGWEGEGILQPFVPGQPASVAFLTGPSGIVPLLPAAQHLSADGRFHYLGGSIPLPPGLSARAVRLAERALRTLPGLRGYVGVDLVLGETEDGGGDWVIEINPRLTTSYVGLRALARGNLAEAMLNIAAGREISPLTWRTGTAHFQADGVVTVVP